MVKTPFDATARIVAAAIAAAALITGATARANNAPPQRAAHAAIGAADAATTARTEDETRTAPREAVADHVVIVSIDGLRPDAIGEYGADTIERLMREGSHSLNARTILPSKTLPSHTSMLTGLEPAEHGIEWNSRQSDEHGVVGVPTIFDLAKRQGLRTAAFFSKAKFHHLARPGSLDHWQAPSSNLQHWTAPWTVAAATDYMRHERPNLTFVHIGEPDYAGHTLGWMGWLYGLAVKRADDAVEEIVQAADDAYGRGNYTLILTADHGGHDRGHGSDDPRDMTIPWLVWGQGVEAGYTLPHGIRIMDTAATSLWLLGVDMPDDWTGLPVATAFTPNARTLADAAQEGRLGGRFSAVTQNR